MFSEFCKHDTDVMFSQGGALESIAPVFRCALPLRMKVLKLLILLILGSGHCLASELPFPFKPEPGRALVYFASVATPLNIKVNVGAEAVGVLPKKSYLGASVEPGVHLVWGSVHKQKEWFEFEADKTYFLLDLSVQWFLENPAALPAWIEREDLKPAHTAHADLEKLKKKAAKKYKKAVERAGNANAVRLPVTFKKAHYKGALESPRRAPRGELYVDALVVRFSSEEVSLTIPTENIRYVGFGGLDKGSITYGHNTQILWMQMGYIQQGRRVREFLGVEIGRGDVLSGYNQRFTAISKALESSRSR